MKLLKYIAPIIYTIIIFTIISCKTTDWHEIYRQSSKEPFGTYIIRNEISKLFDDSKVIVLKKNVYDYLDDVLVKNKSERTNYICIKYYADKLDKLAIDKLLKFVSLGNTAFLSLNEFNYDLQKVLKFKTKNLDIDKYSVSDLKALSGTLYLRSFEKKSYFFNRNIRRNYFYKFDSKNTIVLGYQNVNGKKQPNFIKVKYGEGLVYLHTQPITFTNYYLLKGDEKYLENVMSFLPDGKIIWDTQLRKRNSSEKDDNSVLKFFWKHRSLKWSLYVAFFGLLLFLAFNARRKQRAVPTVERLKNSTADFTHTIGNLYLKQGNHKNIVEKKTTYFLERVRSKYLLDTQRLSPDFIEKLASKSGNEPSKTKHLIKTIIDLNKKSDCTSEDLIRLNTLIEDFS